MVEVNQVQLSVSMNGLEQDGFGWATFIIGNTYISFTSTKQKLETVKS
jgi:hypothetical protein